MHRIFIFALATLWCSTSTADIILSEIMFNPQDNERYDEFIELYNLGDESVDLFGWLLSDGTKINTILPYDNSSVLEPGQYGLILVPNYFQNSLIYDEEIPEDALLFTIDRAQLGAYGLKNTEGEPISIFKPDTSLIATHQYTPDNNDGFSEEKVILENGDANNNWQNSTKLGGTPGYENSVTPKPVDMSLTRFDIEPATPSTLDSIVLFLTIKNVGLQPVTQLAISLYDSSNDQIHSILTENMSLILAAKDLLEYIHTISPLSAGEHVFLARTSCAGDDNFQNNVARANCRVIETYPRGCIVLNEVMYDTDEKADEWVEVYNASERTVNLANWSLQDKKKSTALTTEDYTLKPGEYCVLCNSELPVEVSNYIVFSLPELNNSGDVLLLRDAAGRVIDSLVYDKSFGGERHVSMERIRFDEKTNQSANWGNCVDVSGGTPGQLNSISPKAYDAAIYGPLLLSPIQPMAEDFCSLSVNLKNAGRSEIENIILTAEYRPISDEEFVRIDSDIVEFLNVNENVVFTFEWDNIPAGTHIVKINLDMPSDMVLTNNQFCDTISVSYPAESLVMNEIMYSPAGGGEWIELYNKSDSAIELMNWTICDSDTLARITISETSYLFKAGTFLVLCADSSLLNEDNIPCHIIRKFPSLNNNADTVHVYDACQRSVDNVRYTSDWGGATGRSLERINPNISAAEKTNWTTCVTATGHTAGAANSVFVSVMPQNTSLSVIPDPFSPDGDGFDDFVAVNYNVPGTTAHVNLKIYDMKGRLVRFLLNNEPSGAERTVYWDGLDDRGIKCRIGIYIILFEALNESRMCMERTRKTVVLAGAL